MPDDSPKFTNLAGGTLQGRKPGHLNRVFVVPRYKRFDTLSEPF